MCEVDVSLQEKLKKFRFRKETSNAAILSESASDLCECVQTPDAHSAHVLLLSEDRHEEAAGGAGGRIRGQCDPAAALRVRRSKVISPVCVCVFQDISLDQLREELPERQPRYPHNHVIINHKNINLNHFHVV